MELQKLVIIGNGMATSRLLDELLSRDASAYQITVFGDEPGGAYNRIQLSPLLAGDTDRKSIQLKSNLWYKNHGISLHSNDAVVEIDRAQRFVISHKGLRCEYDQLILATGSRPARIPADNQALAGIFDFRTEQDVEHILAQSARSRDALVIGGGLLGLEAADALAKKGLGVTLIHRGDWLMNRQLDACAGELLRAELALRGIRFVLGDEISHFEGSEQLQGAVLKSGTRLDAQLAIIATGITPNSALARSAALECDRGLQVDDLLRSSDARISALGECIEHRGRTFGLVAPIWEQARLLADRLVRGLATPYRDAPVPTKLKVSGINLFSAGEYLDAPELDSLTLGDSASGVYRKLLLRDNRLVGVVLYGDVQDGQWYFELMQRQQDLGELLPQLIFGRACCLDEIPEVPVTASITQEIAV
ncbi:nitrite reductase [Marinobacterium aestuarii]|uniref:Nitrite reductase n=1 Tax=Marinobacterium aestuarii TaxID=1821621 RepID=A0A1A9EYG4_9GAMM|nr:FAD-dependent oxidoreductase [Marinobacterium aestuarii]ANG62559.1 nitrite reductase [Marinobacterium aestuarii]